MKIWSLVTFLYGFVNRPDFSKISIFQSHICVSGRHIGFAVQRRTIIFWAFCSPSMSRKSHETVSLYSKVFRNAIQKIGLGGKFPPPCPQLHYEGEFTKRYIFKMQLMVSEELGNNWKYDFVQNHILMAGMCGAPVRGNFPYAFGNGLNESCSGPVEHNPARDLLSRYAIFISRASDGDDDGQMNAWS